ncbi:MAG: alpha/beta hydrolase [Cyanobacteriota bacterium]|nr:alpha/beta hydrolase [Cyanobacteriota bacterium]
MTTLLEQLGPELLDPQARALADAVQWWDLPGLGSSDPFPVAVLGQGPPLLLLHGFDSSFLEFRRIAPLLAPHVQLFIPDLFGFGFTPRPKGVAYGPESVLHHLDALLSRLKADHGSSGQEGSGQGCSDQQDSEQTLAVVGASMGGAVAVELARRHPNRVGSLLLLAPAGLTGRPMPLPPLLDRLGVWFLSRPGVRRGLCRQAFADPAASVGPPEEQIASLHLQVPGWADALAAFARSGGFAGCGSPLPSQPLHVIWGAEDRILRPPLKQAVLDLLEQPVETFEACGHLPHLDHPQQVVDRALRLLRP